MPQPIHGYAVHIPVVISRPTPLILRRRLRCPDGKRTSQLYTLSDLLRKLAHNKLSVNTVMLKENVSMHSLKAAPLRLIPPVLITMSPPHYTAPVRELSVLYM